MLARAGLNRLEKARRAFTGLRAKSTTVRAAYDTRVSGGSLQMDANQVSVAERLDKLVNRLPAHVTALSGYRADLNSYEMALQQWAESQIQITPSDDPSRAVSEAKTADDKPCQPPAPRVPKGVYLWGSVGSGKSLMMDMFVEAASCTIEAGEQGGQDLSLLGDSFQRLLWCGPQGATLGSPSQLLSRNPSTGEPLRSLTGSELPKFPKPSGLLRDSVRRVHFHEFMSEIHMHMFSSRERLLASFGRRGVDASGTAASSPIKAPNVAAEEAGVDMLAGYRDSALIAGRRIADGVSVLCLDEMQITDVVDALVVSRVFGELFRQGVVVVTTSNRPIEDLYENGLNRDLFLPFLDLMKAHTTQIELAAGVDYRTANHAASTSLSGPKDDALHAHNISAAYQVTDDRNWLPSVVQQFQGLERAISPLEWNNEPTAFGRSIPVAKVGECGVVVSFTDLCRGDFGAADYRAIASKYQVIGIQGVAAVKSGEFDSAKRFVTLIDELYEARSLVAISASESLSELLQAITHPVTEDEDIEAANLAEAFFRSVNAQIRADSSSPFLNYAESSTAADSNDSTRQMPRQQQSDPAAPVAAATTAHAAAVDELRFACSRAESRLNEMLSPAYKNSFDRLRVLESRR